MVCQIDHQNQAYNEVCQICHRNQAYNEVYQIYHRNQVYDVVCQICRQNQVFDEVYQIYHQNQVDNRHMDFQIYRCFSGRLCFCSIFTIEVSKSEPCSS